MDNIMEVFVKVLQYRNDCKERGINKILLDSLDALVVCNAHSKGSFVSCRINVKQKYDICFRQMLLGILSLQYIFNVHVCI